MRQHLLASDTQILIQQHQPLPRPPLKSAAVSRPRLRMVAAAITGKAQLQAAHTAASASRDASGSSLAQATGDAPLAAGDAAAPAGNSSSQEPHQKQQKKRAPKQLKLFGVTESVVVPAAAAGDYGGGEQGRETRVADTLAALLPERFQTVTAAKREVRRGHILLDGSKAKTDM